MATVKGDVLGLAIGEVYVQPDGNVPPVETLFVIDRDRYGLILVDREGNRVMPKSRRLGYNGRRGTWLYSIVCEDGTDPAALLAVGYQRVVERG